MIVQIRKGVKARREAFGALIFTNRTPILAFNDDAFAVWDLIDGQRSVEDIIQTLLVNGSEDAQVRGRVDEFIASCTKLGLITLEVRDSDEQARTPG